MTEDQLLRLERCISSLEVVAKDMADHETRIRSLETRQWYAMGVLGFLAFAVPLVMSIVK
jgi:hypothetical protein